MILQLLMACAPNKGGNKTPDVDSEGLVDSVPADLGCEGEVGLEAGMCAPDFSLVSAAGGELMLSELAGDRVVVLGSATW